MKERVFPLLYVFACTILVRNIEKKLTKNF